MLDRRLRVIFRWPPDGRPHGVSVSCRDVRIALLGAIFDVPMGEYALSAPENVLREFLSRAGHDVTTLSSSAPASLDDPADVYHAHHFGVGTYFLALAGVRPFVFTAHNPFLLSPPLAPTESRIEHLLQSRVIGHADAVVAESEREADILAARFRKPREQFAIIPYGLDLDLYGSGGERADGAELLSVGQLAPFKGHDYLLQMVARLLPDRPSLRLTIVSHQHTLQPEYERRCEELGIAHAVEFIGPLSTQELAERYRSCTLYVHPSLAECFPVTVLEAMACGAPVIATDVGGVAEEIGDAGVLVPARNAEALADAVGRLLDAPQERERLGRMALERTRERYNGPRHAEGHEALYARLTPTPGWRSRRKVAQARTLLAAYERRGSVSALVPSRLRRRTAV